MNQNRKKRMLLTLFILFLIGVGIAFYQHTIQVQAAEAKKKHVKSYN